ncbi:MAG: hypothetical protein N0E48_26940 [Candidatus Thiodiazotropha endolucinida]|nr:hypothetical protein [Candidatus Thiodiazotropha taylori]MCW4346964.1 hypothetical protein [Candidatus Thiodiazotropha endolucinida]
MTTVILGDSRLKGLHRFEGFQAQNIHLNIRSGEKLSDQKRFIKQRWLRHIRGRKLFLVCLGINDIPENIGTLSTPRQQEELSKVKGKINSVIDNIKRYHPQSQTVFATIPPKDVRKSAEKYPHKSLVSAENVTEIIQLDFENFVEKINNTINSFNRDETGNHLALHKFIRIRRGHRRSKFYYNKFRDGLHPFRELKRVWANEILKIKAQLGF